MTKSSLPVLSLLGACTLLRAQSFDELTSFRNREQPFTQMVQIRAGMLGAMADKSDPPAGLDNEAAIDGSVWYHDEAFGNQTSQLDAYAGRDGLYASLRDGKVAGADTVSRLEVKARLWSFWREGFYRGDSYVPVGSYEGKDYEAYLGFGRVAAPELFVEFGPYYRRNDFESNDNTAANYVVPQDFDCYGARIYMEQRSVQLDRRSGLPHDGFGLVAIGEREWNGSDVPFGVNSGFLTELPSALWRARGRIEWYIPGSDTATWEVFGTGAFTDEKDRITNYEAQHPPGNLWFDGQLRLRLVLGDSVTVAPFVQGQYVRILEEDGAGADKKFFFGGGAEGWLHFSQQVSLNAWYSFLDNESRPSVSISEDIHGQHMFWAGMVLRFGGTRR